MLKLNEIRKKMQFNIQTGMSELSVRDIAYNKFGDVIIDFDVYLPSKGKNLQRPLVWTDFQKSELIISILKGVEISNISLIKYRKTPGNLSVTTYKIIDGKQRLTTIISFVRNQFPMIWKHIEYYFDDLDNAAQLEILNLNLKYNIAYEYDYDMISDDDKIAWFEIINFMGTPQDKEHLNNIKINLVDSNI